MYDRTMQPSESILFSGAAPGTEAEFGACAERHGVEEVNFTCDGHTIDRHRGVRNAETPPDFPSPSTETGLALAGLATRER